LPVPRETKARRVIKERKETRVRKGILVTPEVLDPKARKVLKEQVLQARKVIRVLLEELVPKGTKATKDFREHRGHKATRELRETKERKETRATKEQSLLLLSTTMATVGAQKPLPGRTVSGRRC